MPLPIEVAVRATVPLLGAVAVAWLFRTRSAAVMHDIWLMGLLSAVGMCVLPFGLPRWEVGGFPAIGTWPVIGPPPVEPPSGAAGGVAGGAVPVLLWIVPALALLASLGLSWLRAALWVRGATRLKETHSASRLAQTPSAAGSVPILVSDDAPVPFAWGVLRPAVVLPRAALDWPAADLRSTLVHELGHIERRDPWSRLAAEAICCVLWFHPLAWYGARRLRAEGEAACDALVLDAGRSRSEYASQLMRLMRQHARARPYPSLSGGGTMRERLRRLLRDEVSGRPVPVGVRGALVVGWLAVTVATAAFSPVFDPADHERLQETSTSFDRQRATRRGEPEDGHRLARAREIGYERAEERTVRVDRLSSRETAVELAHDIED
ncbi:MAG: M56 family metallopeptidase [Gemmatimonadota bacterium]